MAAVEMTKVSARYPGEATLRLNGIDLALEPGRLCALLGPNGAGKSTLVRVVSGQLPAEGAISILGDPLASLADEERARRIAVVPQRSEVAFGFRVQEVVAMGRAPHQSAFMRATRNDEQVVAEAIATCGLGELADRAVDTLSGGEQKRVHIARAFAQRAPVLLLDEAAAHLDVRHSQALYELVQKEAQVRDLTCLFTTHDLAAAAAHADEVVLMREGAVVACGPVADVMTAELLEATFGLPLVVGEHEDGRRYFLPKTGAKLEAPQ